MKISNKPSQMDRVMASPTQKRAAVEPSQPTRTSDERFPTSKERIPFGMARAKLYAKPIPGMHMRWVNDTPGRIQMFLEGGYNFVHQHEAATGRLLGGGQSVDMSDRVSRIVGEKEGGGALIAYLMMTPEELHIENQRPIWEYADKIDSAIRRGKFKKQEDDGRYIPGGQSSIRMETKLEQGDLDG